MMVLVFYYYCILCYAAATTRQRATQERMRREFLSQTANIANPNINSTILIITIIITAPSLLCLASLFLSFARAIDFLRINELAAPSYVSVCCSCLLHLELKIRQNRE